MPTALGRVDAVNGSIFYGQRSQIVYQYVRHSFSRNRLSILQEIGYCQAQLLCEPLDGHGVGALLIEIQIHADLLIVDVRNPDELKQGKIENSVLVPFWNVKKGEHSLPKDRPILLVCAVGGRSYGAMQILARQGYRELYNLKGGMSAWKKAKLPVVY